MILSDKKCDICFKWVDEVKPMLLIDTVTGTAKWFDVCIDCLKIVRPIKQSIQYKEVNVMTKEKRKFKEIETVPFHDFGETPEVEGKLIEIRQGDYGSVYDIELDNNEVITLPTKTVLGTKIKPTMIGKIIRVSALGEKQSQKNKKWKFEDFKVEVEE